MISQMIKLPPWSLILAISIAMLNILQAGIVQGWSSPVLANLQSENSTIPVSSSEGSWIATVLPLVSFFFTPLGTMCLFYFGRKRSLLICVGPFIIFWIMVSVATTVTELIVARGIVAIAMAITFSVIPVYLGEISPDSIRGGIGIGMNIVINLGTLWIYWIGTYPSLWISSLPSALPMIFLFIFYKWFPESPYFLMEQGRKEEAKEALEKLTNSKEVDQELAKIESTISTDNVGNALVEVFTEASYRKALLISTGMFAFAQLTGGITFIFYAHLIFQKAGGTISPNTLSLIKAFFQLLTSIGAAYVVDTVGRKPLLIISCIGSAVFMSCEGVYFYLHDNGYNVDAIWWLPLLAMILFNISQVIGLQSISLAFLGELFHPKVKSVSVCISKGFLALCVFMVGKLFQVMSDYLGNYVPFFVFAGIAVIGVFFVIFYVPETKGKSLEEIQYYMKHNTYEIKTYNI